MKAYIEDIEELRDLILKSESSPNWKLLASYTLQSGNAGKKYITKWEFCPSKQCFPCGKQALSAFEPRNIIIHYKGKTMGHFFVCQWSPIIHFNRKPSLLEILLTDRCTIAESGTHCTISNTGLVFVYLFVFLLNYVTFLKNKKQNLKPCCLSLIFSHKQISSPFNHLDWYCDYW